MRNSEEVARDLSAPAARSLRREAKSGVVWNTLQSLANRFSSLVVFLILARLLAPEAFGLLAAAQVFIALLSVLADAGMTRTLVQRPTLDARHLNAAFLLGGAVGLFMSVLVAAASPLLADLYHLPALTGVLLALSPVPLLSGLSSTPASIMRRQLRFKELAIRSSSSVVVGGALGVVCAFLGAGAWSLVAQSLAQSVVAAIVLYASVDWLPSLRTTWESVRELVGFGLHVLGISVLTLATRRSSELLIGIFLGPTALGLFAVAQRVHLLLLDLLVANATRVALPMFSRLSDDLERLRRAYVMATTATTAVSMPAFALMALMGPQLVPAVFGPQWKDAGPLMATLALLGPLQALAFFNGSLLLSRGLSSLALKYNVFTTVTTVLVFAATVPFGVTWVAWGYTIRGYVLLPVGLLLVRRACNLTALTQLKTVAVPFAGAVAMVLVVASAHLVGSVGSIGWLVVTGASALFAYAIVVICLRPDWVQPLLKKVSPRLRGLRSRPKEAVAQGRRRAEGPAPGELPDDQHSLHRSDRRREGAWTAGTHRSPRS